MTIPLASPEPTLQETAAPASEVAPPAPSPPDPIVESRVRRLEARLENDPVLTEKVGTFLLLGFEREGNDAVCVIGNRVARITDDMLVLSNKKWPGSTRIPL